MGKGFHASDGLPGQDLGQIIEEACHRASYPARLCAIVNDGSATLMSCAYTHETTRFGLILGTGLNLAAYFPVSLVGQPKLRDRSQEWLSQAQSVIVNNEASMFGQEILPVSRWDLAMRKHHDLDLQPLEYMTSGMYLGELARFLVTDAIQTGNLFAGVLPQTLQKPYSLSTAIMSRVARQVSSHLTLQSGSFNISPLLT